MPQKLVKLVHIVGFIIKKNKRGTVGQGEGTNLLLRNRWKITTKLISRNELGWYNRGNEFRYCISSLKKL